MFIKQQHGVTRPIRSQWTAETDKQHSTHSPAIVPHYTHLASAIAIFSITSQCPLVEVKYTALNKQTLRWHYSHISRSVPAWSKCSSLITCSDWKDLPSTVPPIEKQPLWCVTVKLCDSWLCNTHIRPYVSGREKIGHIWGWICYQCSNLVSLLIYIYLQINAHVCIHLTLLCSRLDHSLPAESNHHDSSIFTKPHHPDLNAHSFLFPQPSLPLCAWQVIRPMCQLCRYYSEECDGATGPWQHSQIASFAHSVSTHTAQGGKSARAIIFPVCLSTIIISRSRWFLNTC